MSSDNQEAAALSFGVKEFADCRLVTVSGRIDHTNSNRFLEDLGAEAEKTVAGGGLVVDLGELEFITSAGLRALLLAHRTVSGQGAKLIVTSIDGIVKEVFRISKFDSLLAVSDTVEDAVGQISEPAAKAFAG